MYEVCSLGRTVYLHATVDRSPTSRTDRIKIIQAGPPVRGGQGLTLASLLRPMDYDHEPMFFSISTER
jgi:hypothetical protein